MLIVEDNSVDGKFLLQILKENGDNSFVGVHVESLTHALEQIKTQKIDIILLDLFLTDSEGVESVKKINEINSKIPIIILTGLDDKKTWLQALKYGVQDYLVKGKFTPESLLKSIHYAIERKNFEVQIELSAKMAILGELAGNVAHEINNPLSIIVGLSTQAQTKILNGKMTLHECLEKFETIHKNTWRIVKIVKALKSYMRDDHEDPIGILSLKEIFNDISELSQDLVKTQDIKLEISFSESDAFQIKCHATALTQVLLNLIKNACEAIQDKKEKWIRVDAQFFEQTFQVTVTDSGTGVDPSISDKIFEPFFTTKGSGKGIGVGLSLCQKLILAHSGTLKLDQTQKNTTFVICLPIESKEKARAA